jgi:anti-anti-sigma factor
MQIEKQDHKDFREIILCPRINIHNVFDVEEQITEMIDDTSKNIVFNFKDVEYFGSNGIRILMLAKRKMDKTGGRMILVHMNNFVMRILKAIDLVDIFEILPDLDSAAKDLES